MFWKKLATRARPAIELPVCDPTEEFGKRLQALEQQTSGFTVKSTKAFMKQGLERRLRKLEEDYELDSRRVIRIRWLTADEISRGCKPGLKELPPDAVDSRAVPGSAYPEGTSDDG